MTERRRRPRRGSADPLPIRVRNPIRINPFRKSAASSSAPHGRRSPRVRPSPSGSNLRALMSPLARRNPLACKNLLT